MESKGLKVFLCKHENNDDFYDSINAALVSSKHFILVACDKDMLSNWIYDEVKQFDSLRKNGEKPKCLINAYIFGDITKKDLYTFNTVFSSRDIKSGESGFCELYQQILIKENESEASFKRDKNLTKFRYLDLTNIEVADKIFRCIEKTSCLNQRSWKSYARELFGFYNIEALYSYLKRLAPNTDFLVIRLFSHYMLDNFIDLSEITKIGNLDYILFITDGSTSKPNDLIDVSAQKTIHLDKEVTISYQNAKLLLLPQGEDMCPTSCARFELEGSKPFNPEVIAQEGDEDLPVTCLELSGNKYSTRTEYCEIEDVDFLSFIVHTVADKFAKESWMDPDTSNYFKYQFTERFDVLNETERFDKIYRRLVSDENEINRVYKTFKSTGSFDNRDDSDNDEFRYRVIINKVREFCLNKNQSAISEAIALLDYERRVEINAGSHYRQEALLLIMAELIVNNVFIFDSDPIAQYNIIEELRNIASREVIPDYVNYIHTIILALEKEQIFVGSYQGIAESLPAANMIVLNLMTKQIEMLMQKEEHREIVVSQLFLLFRQRAVIWEHLGDTTSDCAERIKYYKLWMNDSLNAINYGSSFDSHREILGCAYLNYASALNRLAKTNDSEEKIRKSYSDCLKNLETAYSVLRGTSARRYLGYVYLHRSDCYSAMMDSGMYDNSEIISSMNVASRKAQEIFKETNDPIGRGWSMRLLAKAIIYSEDTDIKTRVIDGLNKLKIALEIDSKACVVKEISNCIHDFTIYMKMIDENMLSGNMGGLITQIFSVELEAFTAVVKNVGVRYEDISPVQTSLSAILDKLLD